ncbi:alpha/beta hydrolase [Alicyclobacillus sp. SO9]|uniref:alpha/beta hydrolase n=1 Tax=Alicyclobacillus sp. SO9 TaxID=2665646 RepID=UPI0018E70618|nr:alpha/beta fold hydrolase [Alicyclobacillus sp. SO9]QQE77085.1 alpha/beta fold hydrolase [Alicyclobacillus sp. SO9]
MIWAIVVVAVVLILLAWIAGNAVLGWYPTRPARHYPSRAAMTTTPAEYGLPFEDVKIAGRLSGWLIPTNRARPTVIFVHGWAGSREEPWVPFLGLAKEVYQRKMNTVLFDLGYVSGSRPYTGGSAESNDVLTVVDWVRSWGDGPIIVWGFSAGGHATLSALGETGNRIDCAITDSAFVSAFDSFATMYQQMLHLPKLFFVLVPAFFWLFTGYFPKRIRSVANRPLLVIHGSEDSSIPVANGRWLSQWTQTEYWEVSGTDHEGAFQSHPEEYIERCFRFIDRCIPASSVDA